MKIARVNIYLIASGKLHPVIVEVLTDEGISGIGEAAIAYGLGGTAAAGMVKDLTARMLIGRDPFRIEEIWSEMYDHSFWAKGGGPIVFAAISAIEQALWDIKGKALDLRISRRQDARPGARICERLVRRGYDAHRACQGGGTPAARRVRCIEVPR